MADVLELPAGVAFGGNTLVLPSNPTMPFQRQAAARRVVRPLQPVARGLNLSGLARATDALSGEPQMVEVLQMLALAIPIVGMLVGFVEQLISGSRGPRKAPRTRRRLG